MSNNILHDVSIRPFQKGQIIKSSEGTPCPICGRTEDDKCSWENKRNQNLYCFSAAIDGTPATIVDGRFFFTGKYCTDGIHGPKSIAIYSNQKPKASTKPVTRESFKKQNKNIDSTVVAVEIKVGELALMVSEGYETVESAQIELAAWCVDAKADKYSASQLLKAKLREVNKPTSSTEIPRLLKEYEYVRDTLGDRLRFNFARKEVELDGQILDPSAAKLELVVGTHRMNLKGCREDISDIIIKLADQNTYSPIADYLSRCLAQHGANDQLISAIASRYLGADEPIHQIMVKRFLIAAVARVFEPGCKHDCALILQGKQGCGKSTFLKTLASKAYFDDSLGSSSDKDEKIKLHRAWIMEWAELETAFRRRDVSQIKAFMSSATDILRPPYGRSIQILERASVIAGSTNQHQFLADPTGNRRFWVVPMRGQLDVAKLSSERDQIWAAATALYKAGEPWYLSNDEKIAVDNDRKQYESIDPWLYPIQEYIEGRDATTTEAILINACELEKSRHTPGQSRRVADLMRILDWEQTANAVAHYGSRKRVWKSKPSSVASLSVSSVSTA
jgi:predicted P-loop ATPase